MAMKAALLALLAGAAFGQVLQPINSSDLVKSAPAKLNWDYQLLYDNVWTQTDTGAADAYAAGLNPNPLSLGAIGPFYLLIGHTNTTTIPTLNVNFLGARPIKHRNLSNLAIGGLVAGGVYPFRYVTSCDCFQTEDDEGGGGGGGGTVTSVSFTGDGVIYSAGPTAPVTVSGTLTPVLQLQSANRVFAGPTTGSPSQPTFRLLVAADIPALSYQAPLTFFGGGTGVPRTSALGVSGNCAQWDGTGLGDSGAPCSGGGGGGGANALGFYLVTQAANAPANAINLGTLSTGIAKLSVSGSVATASTVASPTGAIVGDIDTQTLTNKTVDGVTPTVFARLDPTSSVQTQLNAKQATITLGTTSQYFKGDLSLGTTPTITGSAVLKGSSGNAVAAGFADVIALFGGGTCSGFPKSDGTCALSTLLWSSLGNPGGNLALTMGANTTTFTYNAATGANDLVKYTDTTGNIGTGVLLHATTGSGSAATPWQADANGCGWKVDTTGAMASTGCAANVAQLKTNTSGNTDMAGRVTLVAAAGTYTFVNTYASAPVCMAQDQTNAAMVVSVTTTTTTITFGGTGTDVVRYICVGLN